MTATTKTTVLIAACVGAAAAAPAADVTQRGTKLIVTGANFRYTWDTRRGGELSAFEQRTRPTHGWWNEADPRSIRSPWKRINSNFAWKSLDTIPALSFSTKRGAYYSGEWHVAYANADNKATLKLLKKTPREVVFETTSRPKILENRRSPVPWQVKQRVRVFDSGVVLTDLEIVLPKDELYELDWSQMFVNLDDSLYKEPHPDRQAQFAFSWAVPGGTVQPLGRWRNYLQDLKHLPLDVDVQLKGTVFTKHPLLFGAAGYNTTHVEGSASDAWMACSLESARSLVGTKGDFGSHFMTRGQSGMSPVPTWEGSMRPNVCFGFGWNLFDGKTRGLNEPLTYRNRLTLAAACRKRSSRADAPADDRNVLLGARVYAASKVPTAGEVKSMAADGCDTLILPRAWRADAAATAAAVKAAHAAGIRVGATVDTGNLKALVTDAKWFTGVFQPGRDGLYLTRASFLLNAAPAGTFTAGGEKVTFERDGAWRTDAASFALCMRALRRTVGPGGFLIGEPGTPGPDLLSLAEFDLYVAPDPKTQRWTQAAARCGRHRTGAGFGGVFDTLSPDWLALAAMHADTPVIRWPARDKTHLAWWRLARRLPAGGFRVGADLLVPERKFTTSSADVHGTLFEGAAGKAVLLLAAQKDVTGVNVRFDVPLAAAGALDGKAVAVANRGFAAGAMKAWEVKGFDITLKEVKP